MQSWQLKLVGYGAVLVASGGLGLGLGRPLPAQAAAYRTVATQKIAKHAYHRKGQHGVVYNRAHTKRIVSLRAYPHTTWYATQKATLRHGHAKGVYLYVANASRSVKGWVWHGYLKRGKAAFHLKYAKGAVALDANTGKVVWAKNANHARPIASTSKIMTLYLTLKKVHSKSGSWHSIVKTNSRGLIAMGKNSSVGGFRFKAHHKYTVKELYYAAYLDSSNNAAIALGKWVAGSNAKFIRQMNAQARAWHLGHAKYVSASGLENSDLRRYGYAYGTANANEVSPKDLAIVARHLITKYPRVVVDGKIGAKTVNGQLCYNYNNLLPGRKYYRASLNVDGLKTGYTPLAGYCFVGTAVRHDKHRVITVVLHDENEFTETRSLMTHAFAAKEMNY